MSTQPTRLFTCEEYLAFERDTELKHEFYRGEIFAMGGASREHNLVSGNIFASLHHQLAGRNCVAFTSDMRVKISGTGLYTYPDVAVSCEQPKFEDEHLDTLLNPQVIVEVLSDSTEKYDRGKKFEHYRTLESLREYVLVAQDAPRVEHFARLDDGSWRMTVVIGLEAALELPALACRLPLSEIYARVDFSTAESSKPPNGKELFD
jgi:Uma2 family endonuclease